VKVVLPSYHINSEETTSQNVWFGPELIRINPLINGLIKNAQSAVSKNRAERGFFFAASAAKF